MEIPSKIFFFGLVMNSTTFNRLTINWTYWFQSIAGDDCFIILPPTGYYRIFIRLVLNKDSTYSVQPETIVWDYKWNVLLYKPNIDMRWFSFICNLNIDNCISMYRNDEIRWRLIHTKNVSAFSFIFDFNWNVCQRDI